MVNSYLKGAFKSINNILFLIELKGVRYSKSIYRGDNCLLEILLKLKL